MGYAVVNIIVIVCWFYVVPLMLLDIIGEIKIMDFLYPENKDHNGVKHSGDYSKMIEDIEKVPVINVVTFLVLIVLIVYGLVRYIFTGTWKTLVNILKRSF